MKYRCKAARGEKDDTSVISVGGPPPLGDVKINDDVATKDPKTADTHVQQILLVVARIDNSNRETPKLQEDCNGGDGRVNQRDLGQCSGPEHPLR